MRWESLYIAGLGSYLPQRVMMAERAVAEGLYDAKVCAANGYRSVRVAAEGETGPVMAAKAGRLALQRSGLQPGDVGLLLHTYASYQGRDLWTPASYIQNEILGDVGGPAFEVRGGCNGGLSALELAASYITVRPGVNAALVTTGDAFQPPYIDRWAADEQTIYGDGSGAMVISTQGGFARVRATVSNGDPTLEELERGSAPWTSAPFLDQKPISFSARKLDYLMRDEDALTNVLTRMGKVGDEALQQALAEAETDIASVKFCTHTTFNEPIGRYGVYGRLGFDRSKSSFDWALGIGQMGAGDELIGMTHIAETKAPQPGDLLVAIGGGTGFICTVAVIEFLETPHW